MLGKIAQNYVYSQIDLPAMGLFGNKRKISDVCKKYSIMTEEQILAEIQTNKETRIANLKTEIAKATEELNTLE